MKTKNIAIIGGGYVGLHTALKINKDIENLNITIFDIDEIKINKWNNNKSPIDDYFMDKFINENSSRLKNITYKKPDDNWGDYDMFFLSLSTNPKPGEERLNTDFIFSFVKQIKSQVQNPSIIIRSTINIDDSDKCIEDNIGYWPEFLSQGIETNTNLNRKSNIIYLPFIDENSAEFFDRLFNGKELIKMSPQEAIMVKVMHNTLDAYLISISNLFANISEENNIDFQLIAPAVESLLKTRTKVKKPGIGYGGSCYPKDSYSLINSTSNQVNKNLIQSFEDFNIQQSYAFLSKKQIIDNAKNIVVLGVSFKGGTNDITKTPTLSLRNWLIDQNINYIIWEPMINEGITLEGEIISEDIKKDINESDLVIVATDWAEFNTLLSTYDKEVIDLKSFITDNGLMNLHYIGKR